ncbi:MAG: PilZ domain-containing protein [Gammaproteobacteria bacterium]|nr:PilZ domain-containing protein [Gammaproteobacteria bacterium]
MLNSREYSEKRNFGRMTVECSMGYKVAGSDEMREGQALDLSSTGMLFTCTDELESGMQLKINITPGNSLIPPLDAMAEVMRVAHAGEGQYEVGIKITEFLGE